MRKIKALLTRILSRLGYYLVKEPRGRRLADLVSSHSADTVIAALPEIIRKVQPAGLPPVEGHQLEMATYHLKTGMADADPEFFPLYERCREYSMTSWDRLYNLYLSVRYVVRSNI